MASTTTWAGFGALAAALLVGYLFAVFLLGEAFFGLPLGPGGLVTAVILGAAAGWWGTLRSGRDPRTAGVAKSAILAVTSSVLALLVADTVYTATRHSQRPYRQDSAIQRYGDAAMWCRRLNPPFYWPTEYNFRLLKADVYVEGVCEGDLFDPLLALRFPELAKRIAEPRRVTHRIDGNGFRETTALAEARTFALGDSFTFAYGVSQEQGWVKRLERQIRVPIYNLGVTDTSPRQQLMLLRHLLETRQGDLRIGHLLWMIFEGNDLEDSYATRRPAMTRYELTAAPSPWEPTLLADLRQLPFTVRDQSMILALRRGGLRLVRRGGARPLDANRYRGLLLRRPLYRSERFGYRFFEPRYTGRASQPASYVEEHPNRPALDRTMRRMAALAEERGFAVSLLIAPTAVRLYADAYEGLEISRTPHFIDHVAALGERLGFEVVDLHRALSPHAEHELLYWRDDNHWNLRGNELVAQLVAERLGAELRRRTSP